MSFILASDIFDFREERKVKALLIIDALLESRDPPLNDRMRLLGTFASMHLAIPPKVSGENRAMTREFKQQNIQQAETPFIRKLQKKRKRSDVYCSINKR
ncbi:hypothetical protein V3C99_008472 [Haemonchus contortus]